MHRAKIIRLSGRSRIALPPLRSGAATEAV